MALRGCAECDQRDDGPRDVWDDGTGPPVLRHLACCAARGCDSCTDRIRNVDDHLTDTGRS